MATGRSSEARQHQRVRRHKGSRDRAASGDDPHRPFRVGRLADPRPGRIASTGFYGWSGWLASSPRCIRRMTRESGYSVRIVTLMERGRSISSRETGWTKSSRSSIACNRLRTPDSR